VVKDCRENGFAPLLNASHIQDWGDWPTTLFQARDETPVISGMNIADADLRAEIAERFPDIRERIRARQAFMRERLGIAIAEEVLPLSTVPAYFVPLWMARNWALKAS
jgi:hypothetical protein